RDPATAGYRHPARTGPGPLHGRGQGRRGGEVMYAPKFQPQLVSGVPTGCDDCVVRSAQMGIDYATSGNLIIRVADFRKRAGKQTGGLNTAQLEQGVESYDTPSETNRYRSLRAKRFVEGEWPEISDYI